MAEKHSEVTLTCTQTALMLLSEQFETHWKARAFKARKISAKDSSELDKAIAEEIILINYINAQPEGTEYILGRHINDFIIMMITAPLIVKNSIRWIPSNLLTIDLAERYPEFECKITYNQHLENIALINRYQKKDSTADTCTLGSLRGDVSLADVIERAAKITVEPHPESTEEKPKVLVNLRLKYDSTTYIPIVLNDDVQDILYKMSYYNSDYKEMLEDYFVNVQL